MKKNKMDYKVVKATLFQLDAIMQVITDAKELLKDSGSSQWNLDDNYPSQKTFINDIENDILYVCYDDYDNVVGVCAYKNTIDENYLNIKGEWMNKDDDYLSIHRLAVKKEFYGKGVSQKLINYSIFLAQAQGFKSIKVDTHRLNIPMQKLLLKSNFNYCGLIYLIRSVFDNERLAYELMI